jgi:hypothetical protein
VHDNVLITFRIRSSGLAQQEAHPSICSHTLVRSRRRGVRPSRNDALQQLILFSQRAPCASCNYAAFPHDAQIITRIWISTRTHIFRAASGVDPGGGGEWAARMSSAFSGSWRGDQRQPRVVERAAVRVDLAPGVTIVHTDWPRLWANLKTLIGIFKPKFWANPMDFRFRRIGTPPRRPRVR